jgi:hypothetical protein
MVFTASASGPEDGFAACDFTGKKIKADRIKILINFKSFVIFF